MEILDSKGIHNSIDLTENSDFHKGDFSKLVGFEHPKKNMPWNKDGKTDIEFNFSKKFSYSYTPNHHITDLSVELRDNMSFNLGIVNHMSDTLSIYIRNSRVMMRNKFYMVYDDNSPNYRYLIPWSNNNISYYDTYSTRSSVIYNDSLNFTSTITYDIANNDIDITPKEFDDARLSDDELYGHKLITDKDPEMLRKKIKLKEYLDTIMKYISPDKKPERVCKSFLEREPETSHHNVAYKFNNGIDFNLKHKCIDILEDQNYNYLYRQKNNIIDYYYHDRPKNRGLNLLRSKTYRVSVEELTAMEVGINGEEVQPIRRKGDLFGDYEALF